MVALSELRGFAEDREENVVGKREIACKKAISPVLNCFDVFYSINPLPHLDPLKIYSWGKHCVKRRNCLYVPV